jgi:hypothetical protein
MFPSFPNLLGTMYKDVVYTDRTLRRGAMFHGQKKSMLQAYSIDLILSTGERLGQM